MSSDTFEAGTGSYTAGPRLPQEMPKPPFRPKTAGTIAFFFGIVAGALVSVVSLRRMGHSLKAKKVLWVTIIVAVVMAMIVLLLPYHLARLVGLGLELVWYFVFPKIQNEEFNQWQATREDVAPSNGWKALGWGFAGAAVFFGIVVVMGILLDALGIAPL